MYANKPPLTQGAAAILRSRQKPRTPPMGNMRPGMPQPPPPVQPMDKVKPRAVRVQR